MVLFWGCFDSIFISTAEKKSNTFLLENTFESQTAFSQLDSWITFLFSAAKPFPVFFFFLCSFLLDWNLYQEHFFPSFLETFNSLIRLILSNLYQLLILLLWFFWCVVVISPESNFAHLNLLKDSSLSILLITNFSTIKIFSWVKLWTQNSFVMNID